MRALVIAVAFTALLAFAAAGGLGGFGGYYGGSYGGGYGGGYGLGGVGLGSSVVLLSGGGAGYSKAVAGPAFLVKTVHHVSKLHGGGGILGYSGLGGGYGGGYGGGFGGGYGGGYGGFGYGGYGGHGW
ncbi:unnamed protein product [Ixodes persulcatus]